jgi:VCBS repeat-containing protein
VPLNFVGKSDPGQASSHSSEPLEVGPHHGSTDTITIADAGLLFTGDFKRSGFDLVLSKDGHDLVVEDYFRGTNRAALASPDGAQLSGSIVDALTGHVEYAQADGSLAAAKVIGHVTKLAGSATAIRNGVSIQLNVGDNVNKGDVVQAGGGSSLGLTFVDGTVFGLASNARMVLNEMVYDPNGSSNSSLLSLVQGTITFVAGETAKHGDMRVDTPTATMGIRGTAVLVEIDFQVPGQGSAPPVNFQVLVEPNGVTGSYVLYSKTVPGLVLGTVNRAGHVTSVNGVGDISQSQALLTAGEKALIDLTFGQFFQNYVPNPNPQGTGPNGSTPANPVPGSSNPDPLHFFIPLDPPVGQPKTIPINSHSDDTPNAPFTPFQVTFTVLKTIDVTPVANQTSFTIADQVKIQDSNPSDPIVKYVPGTAKILSVTVIGPGNVPAGTDLTQFIAVDPQTGAVSYDPAKFAFLGENQKAVVTIGFDSSAGSDTFHSTLTETINGVNDAPVITAASLAVAEGGTVLFTAANLGITDPDSTSFTYTVSNVTHGKFQITTDGVNWTDATSFTSAELAAGHVRFMHDGGAAAPTFSIQADDGASANHLSNVINGGIDFTNVNVPPVITAAVLNVSEHGTVVLKPSDISVADPDSTSFTFTASNVTHGKFQTTTDGVHWTDATTFTSDDLGASHVRFVDDGSTTAPTITLTASDGPASSASVDVAINFTEPHYQLTSSAGVVIDVTPDGATSGFTFPGAGNVTTPGIPEDRIALGYNNGESHVVLNSAPMLGVDQFMPVSSAETHNADGSNSVSVTLDAGNKVTLTQTITLGSDANFFSTTIDIFNGGTSDLTDVRFLRNIDPDQDVQAHGIYDTYNDVVQNPDGTEQFAIVAATGPDSHVEVALVGIGGDWRGSVYGALSTTDPYADQAFNHPVDPNGALADLSITLTDSLGKIAAGTDVQITYFTTTNVATSRDNMLFGGAGSDVIDGLGGNDLLVGLGGADTFVIKTGYGHDTIYDFTPGSDKIELDFASTFDPGNAGSFNAWLATHAKQVGYDVLIDANPSSPGQTTILLKDIAVGSLHANDFIVHFVDTAPVAAADTDSITAGDPAIPVINGNLLANDTDADHDTLSVSNVTNDDTITVEGTYGELIITKSTGAYTYTLGTYFNPDNSTHATQAAAVKALGYGATAQDTFHYTANDGHLDSISTELTITVTGVNDAPVAHNDVLPLTAPACANVGEDSTLSVSAATLLANDTDADKGDVLSIKSVTATSAHGAAISLSDGNIVYDPTSAHDIQALAAGQTLTDTFTYTVSDNHGGTDTATVQLLVAGINDAPVFTGTAAGIPLAAPGDTVAVVKDVSVSDIDSANFNGGSLTVQITHGADDGDKLSIATTDLIFLHGMKVMFDADGDGDGRGDAVQIGTLTDYAHDLTVSLNAHATDAAVKALAEAIEFRSPGEDPSYDTRTVSFTLKDGGGTANGGHDSAHFDVSVDVTTQVQGNFHENSFNATHTFVSTSGNDNFTGTSGADNFVFASHFGKDVISNFQPGTDHIDLSAVVTTDHVDTWMANHVTASGTNAADTLITIGNDSITLHNVSATNLHANDFIVHPGH